MMNTTEIPKNIEVVYLKKIHEFKAREEKLLGLIKRLARSDRSRR